MNAIKVMHSEKQPKYQLLLKALLHGESITLLESVERWQLYSLSQAVRFLRVKCDVPIVNIGVTYKTGGRIYRYGRCLIAPTALVEQRERFGII